MVHKDYLIKSSAFFQACCDGHDWKESVTKTIELPEQSVEHTSAYVEWLYTGEITVMDDVPSDALTLPLEERWKTAGQIYIQLGRMAEVADQTCDDVFANALIDEFLRANSRFNVWPGPVTVRELSSRLPETSPFHVLLRDFFISCSNAETLASARSIMPESFLFAIAMELLKRQGQPKLQRPTLADRCKYHIHNDKIPKCM